MSPLPKARLAALLATATFAAVASSLGLNALIRSNQSQTHLKKLAPSPTVLVIDVKNITDVGIVCTVGNMLMGILAFTFFNLTLLPKFRHVADRTTKLQAILLGFTVVWVFATLIPIIVWFANDSAGITAFVGQIQLPDKLVAQTVAASGISPKYSTMWYLRLIVIFPWFSIVSGAIATLVLLKSNALVKDGSKHDSDNVETSKEDIVYTEKV